ncbi:MAG TPA: hypothetical protein VGF59_30170, partial [Bryobacteraceae bacterium]
FSEASELVPAFVRPEKPASSGAIDGVWKAVFTGGLDQQPKMVSEIFFDAHASGDALIGTVHAAAWPGDAAISDSTVKGDRISFTMKDIRHSGRTASRAIQNSALRASFTVPR